MNTLQALGSLRRDLRYRRLQRAYAMELDRFPEFFAKWNRASPSWPVAISYDRECRALVISDPDGTSIVVGRARRAWQYHRGVKWRLDFLWKEYLASELTIADGDVVIDIGANIGEFSVTATRLGAFTISCEPEPLEFRCLRANATGLGIQLNVALWNEQKAVTLFSKNDSGDSSLIEMGEYVDAFDVEARTLDDVVRQYAPGRPIKLIKLEAEGAEPEIIAGGSAALRRAEYVTVDAGPERGREGHNTVVEVLQAMMALNFRLVKFGHQRVVMLFRNDRSPTET